MADVPTEGNLFGETPAVLADEWVQALVEAPGVRIERIVSRGHRSPPDFWYDQETDEFVALLRGAAAIRFEDRAELLVMGPGDTLTIPARVRHQVAWTDPEQDTVWLAVHYRG